MEFNAWVARFEPNLGEMWQGYIFGAGFVPFRQFAARVYSMTDYAEKTMVISTKDGYTLYSSNNRYGIKRDSDGWLVVDAESTMFFNDEVEGLFETLVAVR